jgi:ribonuclease D
VRRLWEARDIEAARLDVPPYKVIGNEAFVDIAKARPADRAALSRIRGASHGRASSMAGALLRAVATGIADGDLPPEDKVWLERPRMPATVAKARRAREARVMAWRKGEAQRRGVDEQVVLPGHCVKEIAEPEAMTAEEVASVGGFGACRSAYVEPILLALRGPDAADDVEDDADG